MEKILKAFRSGNSVSIPLKTFGITPGKRYHIWNEDNRVIIEEVPESLIEKLEARKAKKATSNVL